jgi:hypothetical protein
VKLRVVMRDGDRENFYLEDLDTGEMIGTVKAVMTLHGDLMPSVESLTRFQNAKVVVDGKSLRRLQALHNAPISVSSKSVLSV